MLPFSCATYVTVCCPLCVQKYVPKCEAAMLGLAPYLSYIFRSLFYHFVLCLLCILNGLERLRPPFSSGGHGWSACTILALKYKGDPGICCVFVGGSFFFSNLSLCPLHHVKFKDMHHCLSIDYLSVASLTAISGK